MPSPPELGRTQRDIWDLVTAPEGVAASGQDGVERARTLVRGDARLDAVARLDIYANMYFYRLRDCLAEDFPKVAAVTGGAAFHNLITDYLLVYPSTSWSLRELGRALPGFLAGHALSGTHPGVADLARLEWARDDVFDETDAVSLSRADIASLDPKLLDSLELSLIPAFRLLAMEWDAAAVWRDVERSPGAGAPGDTNSAAAVDHGHFEDIPAAQVPAASRRQTHVRVWRRGGRVYHRVIDADEHACLEALVRGATLARLGEIVLDRTEGEGAAIVRLGSLVESWLEESLLVRATASSRTAS